MMGTPPTWPVLEPRDDPVGFCCYSSSRTVVVVARQLVGGHEVAGEDRLRILLRPSHPLFYNISQDP
jgi:hypothetical protein